MCIECIECIGSQADRLESHQIGHNAIKLVKWINDANCPCASSALSAMGHKLTEQQELARIKSEQDEFDAQKKEVEEQEFTRRIMEDIDQKKLKEQ
ncbi:MAG: hypothetical protein EZS28_043167, partial [Streblomastix strix]